MYGDENEDPRSATPIDIINTAEEAEENNARNVLMNLASQLKAERTVHSLTRPTNLPIYMSSDNPAIERGLVAKRNFGILRLG